MTASVYRDAIYASCLQPIFMPLQRVKHPSNHHAQEYMDGGIRDVIPVRAAWDRGATRVLAIALANPRTEPMKEDFGGRSNLFKLLFRGMLGLLDQEVADDDIHEARYLATIGRLARHVPVEHLEQELSLLAKEERERYLAPERFDAFYVHRPSPHAGLKEDLKWTKQQMIGWVQQGRQAVRNGEGDRLARFLEGRAHS
jgi:predicted acylesterase/phospholipase RssA